MRSTFRPLFLNATRGLGGGETWVARMAGALAARGHRPIVAAPAGAALHAITPRREHFRFTALNTPDFVSRLARRVEDEQVTHLVVTLLGSGLEAWALDELSRRLERPRPILLKIGLPPYPGSRAADYGVGLHAAFRRLLVVCEHNRDAFLRTFPSLPGAYVRVLYTGVDHRRFSPRPSWPASPRRRLGIAPGSPLLVNVSRLSTHKGQELLLLAAHRLLARFPDAHLVFAGEGPEDFTRRLRAQAAVLGLAERCHFLGFVDDVRPLLAEATLFLQPSLVEGVPNALLEAMAMRVPSVATRVCGVPELTGEDGARLVPPADVDALADAVCALLADPSARHELARAGQRRSRRFRIEERAGELEEQMAETAAGACRFTLATRPPAPARPHRPHRRPARRGDGSLLIVQAEGMGDQVQAYPFFHLLRRRFADRHVTLVSPGDRRRLFDHFGFDSTVDLAAWKPAGRRFGLAFDLNLRSGLQLYEGAEVDRVVSFTKDRPHPRHTMYPLYGNTPLWQQFVGLLRAVGVGEAEMPWAALRPCTTPEERRLARRLLAPAGGRPLVGVSPGGFSMPEKHWPLAGYVRLLEDLRRAHGTVPVLFGHFRETELAVRIEAAYGGRLLNLANAYPSLGVLLALLERLDLHVANDNGVMHLADVLDVPQVTLFGVTDPRFFGPFGHRTVVVASPSRAMADLPYDEVLEASLRQLHADRPVAGRQPPGVGGTPSTTPHHQETKHVQESQAG